jgi:Winged helix DNA-binding domain
VDAAVARLDVHELPSARGCTYVLPRADFALGLTVGAGAPAGELAAAEKHLGVTDAEIAALSAAVVEALAGSERPLDPAAIRAAVGDAARSLGDAGKKRGLSTTLPLALGLLQARGLIRRVPVNGRLDQQRYGYVRWEPAPLGTTVLTDQQARQDLARRYFDWAAPASLAHFRWFSGFTAASARTAVEPLGLLPVAGTDLLMPPGLADAFTGYRRPAEPAYALLAGIDGLHLLHRDLPRLIDPADAGRPVPGAKAGRVFGGETDSPCQLVVDRGRIVGFWEYDTEQQEIVRQLFRDQLGDARGFSLDSPKSRAPKIAAMRAG